MAATAPTTSTEPTSSNTNPNVAKAAKADFDHTYQSMPDNKKLDHIPGEYGLPYIGKAIGFMKHLHETVDDHYKRFGEVSRVRMGGQEGLLVVGADNYKDIFIDRDNNFSPKMGYDKQLGGMYPDTILLTDFSDHRPVRRMFQGAFKNAAMKGYSAMMNPIMAENLEKWGSKDEIVFFPEIKSCLLDVAAKIFFGLDDLDGEEAQLLYKGFTDSAEALLGLVRKDIPGTKWHKGVEAQKYLRKYIGDLVQERRGNTEKGDTLTFLANERDENGNYFEVDDIVNQAVFLWFAAHDTTTSALCHMVYYTAKHPAWKERCRKQSLAVGKAQLDYEDLDAMEDLDMVFHESLRLHPSVPLMTRRTVRDCELGGYHVPAHTILFIPPTYNHRMAEYWSSPDVFDPERFSPERAEHKNHSFCYLPFGGGAHKCIGMHFAIMLSKCFMHQFLLKYDYELPENYDPNMLYMPLPHPEDGIPLKLKRI